MSSKTTARVRRKTNNTPDSNDAPAAFPIVGVGASAGGVQAFAELVRRLPAKPGLAIVFVLHTERHESALAEVLGRSSKMPVRYVTDGTKIERDHIYVSHPDSHVAVIDGTLRVENRPERMKLPIDLMLATLAEDQRTRSIAVILSGSDADGALGAKAVKVEGGITFAQDDTAQFRNMPQAAIAAGAIDFVLPVDEISRELVRVARGNYMTGSPVARLDDEQMSEIFALLKAAHDVDFAHYKPATIERRVRRRMVVHRIDRLEDYVTLVRSDATEVDHLYGDILIRVTAFFRDPGVFAALQRDILPALMQDRPADSPVRVWVPGCATGEEVYSLAIALLEVVDERSWSCPIQIFGTDISDAAIETARIGLYPPGISADISPERLQRFFTKSAGGYRVKKSVRDCCVFARQNVTKDPPFSRLDLISCRNVLIYLGSVLQRKVMAIFHYALRPSGYLLLGSSESIGTFADLFSTADRKHRVYTKKSGLARVPVEFEATPLHPRDELARNAEHAPGATNVYREADRMLLSRFSPPGVLVNEALDILQFRGRTSPWLEPAPGAASFSLLKMAREGLLSDLRTAVQAARTKEMPVRREGVQVKNDGGMMTVNLEVLPFVGPSRDRYYLILFENVPEPEQATSSRQVAKRAAPEAETRHTTRLRRELESTREYLQSIIEEQEAMNEELRSANEEIQSSNEELQSANEELETAKEELQSSNEELTTLNEELENRATELAEVNNDLTNLLASIDIPIVMLDSTLRIRRFNPGAQRVLNLLPGDIGRQMGDMTMTLMVDGFERLILDVIETLEVKEVEVKDRAGRTYMLRVRPYRTIDNRIEGAVLALIDVDQFRKRNNAASA
jgi:two-component system, chemotaxis family, CheB/CheR fusion protein